MLREAGSCFSSLLLAFPPLVAGPLELELDPLFLKALRLLHSKAKDSAEQLRQLIEDTLVQRQGATGGTTGRDTKTLLTTIKLASVLPSSSIDMESDGRAHLLGRRPSPKQEFGAGNNGGAGGGPPALSAVRSFPSSEGESRRKDPPPLECKPPTLTPSATPKPDTPSPVLEVSGLLEPKRARTESPQLASSQSVSSQSVSPVSRVASSSSPDSSSDGEDFTVDMGQVCIMCNQQDVTAKNQLIECQECHCLYHQECHRPPATDYDVNDPRLVWYCARCTKNMKKMAIKPPKPPSKAPFGVPRELTPPSKPDTPPPLTSQPFKRSELKVPALSSSAGPNKPIGLAGLAANLSKPKPLKPTCPQCYPGSPSPPHSEPLEPRSSGRLGGGGNGKSTSSSSLLMSADKRLQIMKKKAAAKMQEKRRVTSK
ncbi:hypothetical protein HPB48_010282 [Haemaphysalis longicornis]|uniref:Integrator complex subunit 12 n=1 Tax=Haemaphysalis longicornis TaxID=44386 RepID=A0A9J6FUY8_HAELO|nr:hypothetical protein HPB48_010282 [Haemaphysalis longicornis]